MIIHLVSGSRWQGSRFKKSSTGVRMGDSCRLELRPPTRHQTLFHRLQLRGWKCYSVSCSACLKKEGRNDAPSLCLLLCSKCKNRLTSPCKRKTETSLISTHHKSLVLERNSLPLLSPKSFIFGQALCS